MSLNPRKLKRIEWWKKHKKIAEPSSDKDGSSRETKQSKKIHGENKGTTVPADSKSAQEHDEKKEKKRYLIFVGNLPFDLTKDDILKHFKCAGNADFRLLTKKDTGRSKGCGFLELDDAKSHKKALNLHHSTLGGRKINVEVTCGGGGSGEKRMEKLNEKKKNFRKRGTKKRDRAKTDDKEDKNSTNSIKETSKVVTGNEESATDEKTDNENKKKGKKRKPGITEEEEAELASTKKKALKESAAITAIVKELQLETLLEDKKTEESVDSSSDKKGKKKKKKKKSKEED